MYAHPTADGRLLPTWTRALQRTLFSAGVLLLSAYLFAVIHTQISSTLALWGFNASQHARGGVSAPTAQTKPPDEHINCRLWAAERIAAYKSSLALMQERPLGILSIPRLRLIAPVFEGTDALTLDRGLGRIRGTAKLGEFGNTGIAGHRDGFFRSLKDVAVGELIEISTGREHKDYFVHRIIIVDPSDVSVLKSGTATEITLVTCFPFYMVGEAPYRYVVQASLHHHQNGEMK
jgi:sortase A